MDAPALRSLLEGGVVFDAHVDALGRALDLGDDLGVRSARGHFDLVRAQEGGVGTWVAVLWVDPERFAKHPFRRAAALLGVLHDLARRHGQVFRMVGNGRELREGRRLGAICGIASIEGGHAIEEDLDKLEWFFERGVRGLTLVWNNHLSWIRSCRPGAGAGVPRGLNEFGRRVVQELNAHGMLVDVSHAGERAFYDVLAASAEPVIASHSGCRALHDHPRNLSDDQLRALADHGGVCGIVFHPGFLDAEARAEEERIRATADYRNLEALPAGERFARAQERMRRQARPLPLSRLGDHIVHAVEVAGIEHVGLGSDFDGIERGPQGCEDATGYPALARHLLDRGFRQDELEAVLGGNFRRLFERLTGPGSIASARQILLEPPPAAPATP